MDHKEAAELLRKLAVHAQWEPDAEGYLAAFDKAIDALEIAQRYEEAVAVEVHKYPARDGLAQFYKHLAGATEALEPGTYRLVLEVASS